jgi:hypothetical protein
MQMKMGSKAALYILEYKYRKKILSNRALEKKPVHA